MIEQIGRALTFDGFYTASGSGKTGLTVTVDVYNPAGSLVVTAGSATEVGGGLYKYTLSSGSVTTAGNYRAVFKTADTTVDQKHVASEWIVGTTWVEYLDTALSGIPAAVLAIPTITLTVAGTIGKLIVDNLNATVSSRSSHSAADVWTSPTRTLSSFGTLVADIVTAILTVIGQIWDEPLAAHQSAGSTGEALALSSQGGGGATAEEVWAYGTRTLTQTAVEIEAAIDGDPITRKRGNTWEVTIVGLGSLVGRTRLWFTIKSNPLRDDDSASIVQIEEVDGLLHLNGSIALDPANASLVVDDEDAGNVTITISEEETKNLTPGNYRYDVKQKAAAVVTLTEGAFVVTPDITRAIA